MRLVIVSGLSGSGKSVALHMLEDLEYYCVDNIPAGLLPMFISHTVRSKEGTYEFAAVGVDARNSPGEIASVPKLVDELKRSGLHCDVLSLRAEEDTLLKRYSETRRRHPLSRTGLALSDAIQKERELMHQLAFFLNCIGERETRSAERMPATRLAVALEKRVFLRAQGQDVAMKPAALELVHELRYGGDFAGTVARIHSDRREFVGAFLGSHRVRNEHRQKSCRDVVNAVVLEVFEHVQGHALARTGEAADDDETHRGK